MKYVRSVPLKKLDLKIKRESGFSMKSKETIEEQLQVERDARDGSIPMDEMTWANNQGWIEALEFALDIDKDIREQKAKEERLSKILLSEEERSSIIGKAIDRIQRENELINDDEDSENNCICVCGEQGSSGCSRGPK